MALHISRPSSRSSSRPRNNLSMGGSAMTLRRSGSVKSNGSYDSGIMDYGDDSGQLFAPSNNGRDNREDDNNDTSYTGFELPADLTELSPPMLISKLEQLLIRKADEIQMAGRLGESLLSQQAELEQKIQELEQVQQELDESGVLSSSRGTTRRGITPSGRGGEDDDEDAKLSNSLGEEARKRLEDLETEMKNWEKSNDKIFAQLGAGRKQSSSAATQEQQQQQSEVSTSPLDLRRLEPTNDASTSKQQQSFDSSLDSTGNRGSAAFESRGDADQPLGGPAASSAAASRRARNNAQHRANDIEFATEIGQSLLGEVRRLQALLVERDDQIREDRSERDALERDLDALKGAHKLAEEDIEKYKEENWNLEVVIQDIRSQLSDLQSNIQKSEQERNKLVKQLSTTRDGLESQKTDNERLRTQFDEFKQKHETSVAQWRKDTAGLQREKSDIQGAFDQMKTQMASGRSRFGRVVSGGPGADFNHRDEELGGDYDDFTMDETDHHLPDDVFGGKSIMGRRKTGDLPAPPSPGDLISSDGGSLEGSPLVMTRPDNEKDEINTLRSSLAQAHKLLTSLKSDLQKERDQTNELRGQIAEEENEENNGEWEGGGGSDDVSSSRETTPAKIGRGSARGGRGRGGRGRSVGRRRGNFRTRGRSKLGQEIETDDDDDDDDDNENLTTFFGQEHVKDDRDSIIDHDDSSEMGLDELGDLNHSHRQLARFSADGIDPEFAGLFDRNEDDSGRSVRGSSPASHLDPKRFSSDSAPRLPGSIGSLRRETRPSSAMFGGIEEELASHFANEKATPPPQPQPELADASTMTEEVKPPPPPREPGQDIACQTLPTSLNEALVQTDPPASKQSIEIQTDEVEVAVAPEPVVAEESPVEEPIPVGRVSTSTDEDSGTETEGQGDGDAFEDARESVVGLHTPSASISFKPSTATNRESVASATSPSQTEDAVEILGTSVADRDTTPQPALLPKVVTEERGIQTDDLPLPPQEVIAPSLYGDSKRDSASTFGGARGDSPPRGAPSTGRVVGPVYVQTFKPRSLSPELRSDRPDSIATSISRFTDSSAPAAASSKPTLDKSKPPTFSMPPPPSIPPPKNLTPPPHRKSSNAPPRPPRPSSPPPPDLLQRAQTPTLAVPGTHKGQLRTVTSFASVKSNGTVPMSEFGTATVPKRVDSLEASGTRLGRERSSSHRAAALASSAASVSEMSLQSEASRRMSMASSRTSEGLGLPPQSPDRPMNPATASTDPSIIHAITQTMIGEFLFKYTRRSVMKGYTDKRHRRFFWVHPYTKTLYWSSSDPGASNVNQSSAKSVFVEGVKSIVDENPNPPGLHQYSIIIQTPNRDMKITAPSRERHEMWLTAMTYLLARPDELPTQNGGTQAPALSAQSQSQSQSATLPRMKPSPLAGSHLSPTDYQGGPMYAMNSASDSRLTPKARGKLSSNTYKRPNTPAAEYVRQHGDFGSPTSLRSFDSRQEPSMEVVDHSDVFSADGHDHDHDHDGLEGYEGIENVRACCNGRHAIPTSAGHRHHHHHHHDRPSSVAEGDYQGIFDSPTRARSKSAASHRSHLLGGMPTNSPRKSLLGQASVRSRPY